MNQSNANVTVECAELEAIKQQAMEIALRAHVLQGGNLLDELKSEPPAPQKKRVLSRFEIGAMVAVSVVSVGGSIAANVFHQPLLFVPAAGAWAVYSVYVSAKKKQREKNVGGVAA